MAQSSVSRTLSHYYIQKHMNTTCIAQAPFAAVPSSGNQLPYPRLHHLF